jgi:hypothetical protein
LLLVALVATACVPPSCFDRTYGFPKRDGLLRLTTLSQPIEGSLERKDLTPMHHRFEKGAYITVNTAGRMTVSRDVAWPEACPTMSEDDLVAVSHHWQPVLDRMIEPRSEFRAMTDPDIGSADWRPDGPLLELQFGRSGKSILVLWDGRSHLADSVKARLMDTLERVCSSSERARKYLLRDLPREVAGELDCR